MVPVLYSSLDYMEYADAFDESLCIEQTPDQINIDNNSMKRKYIERVCTSMRCSTTLARKISDYECRFTDPIGKLPHPKGRHGNRRLEDENIVTHETEHIPREAQSILCTREYCTTSKDTKNIDTHRAS